MRIDNATEIQSVGKYRKLQRLSDSTHRFAMLAIDQRGSLQRMLAQQTNASESAVPGQALEIVKEIVTSAVAPLSTAVLTDPLHGYPRGAHAIPPGVGLLLALEVTGYEAAGASERRSSLIDGWSARKVAQAGADAAKLLLWHRADASESTLRHQEGLVEQVGAECADEGLPFVLEIVTYPPPGYKSESAPFAREKAKHVIDAARRYTAERFGVDLLKLEFPGNLKYVEEYQTRPWAAGESVCDLADVVSDCRRLDDVSRAPWVILSGGVGVDEFVENVRLANAAGASGFLCGRAVWKEVVSYYPDESAMRQFARHAARDYFARIRKANAGARPWSAHPRFITR